MTTAHIANLEASRDVPSPEVVIGIARLLSVSIDYLLRDTIPLENLSAPLIGLHDDQTKSFGAQLRALRLQHQLSQRDLARTLGLASRAYIGGLESDRGKQMQPFVELGVDYFMLDCQGFPDLTTATMLVTEVLPALNRA